MIKLPRVQMGAKTIWALLFSIVLASAGVGYLIHLKETTASLRADIVPSLPGPNDKISPRSQRNIEKLLVSQKRVLGVWVAKLHYDKTENPIIWYSTTNPEVMMVVKNYAAEQLSGKGNSSAENNVSPEQRRILRNTKESREGQIVCGALAETSLPEYSPSISTVAKSVCRASIPPFTKDVNLVIIAVIDIPMTNSTPESIEIRRALLELQLDIYNRDYLNREVPVLNTANVNEPEKLVK